MTLRPPSPIADATTRQKIDDGLTQFRAVARGQPITVGLLMLGLGYLLARISTPRRRRR